MSVHLSIVGVVVRVIDSIILFNLVSVNDELVAEISIYLKQLSLYIYIFIHRSGSDTHHTRPASPQRDWGRKLHRPDMRVVPSLCSLYVFSSTFGGWLVNFGMLPLLSVALSQCRPWRRSLSFSLSVPLSPPAAAALSCGAYRQVVE